MHITSADLCDREGLEARSCVADWRSFGGRKSLTGLVQTVRVFEDAALILQALSTEGRSRILVVDAGASRRVAVLGDRIAGIGMRHGWAGVLIHGAVRDVEALGAFDFGVFALGSAPKRCTMVGTGEIGTDLWIAGTPVRPGDLMAMDADGVALARDPMQA